MGSDNSSTTFSGGMFGSVSPGNLTVVRVIKTGTGVLTLTGENSYTGITRIDAGTLRAGSATALSNFSNYRIASGATLDLNGFNSSVNNLSGAGTLNLGSGTLSIGSTIGTIVDNFAGTITGTGGVSLTRAGFLTLSGTSSYSGVTAITSTTSGLIAGAANAFSPNSAIQFTTLGGSLDLNGFNQTIGSLAGNGEVSLGSARLTLGGDNTDTTFIGDISGTGGITKVGNGLFAIRRGTGYTGDTVVNAGTLLALGGQPSQFIVNGGRLVSDGVIGGVTVNGGTLYPGSSTSTLTVNGNVHLGAGGTYLVSAETTGASSKIVANGTASLGGTLQVMAGSGVFAPATSYAILTATGGVSGTFSTIATDLAFLTPSASYGSNAVTLILTRNDTDFAQVAANPDQSAAADAIASTGFGNPIYNAILGASAADARNAFTVISGSVHAAILSAQLENGQGLRTALLDHLTRDPGQGAGLRIWSDVLAGWSGADGSNGAVGMDGDSASLMGGADMNIGDDWRVGGTIGYDISNLDLRDHASRARLSGGHVGLYGAGSAGPLALRAGGLLYVGTAETHRDIAFLGFTDTTTSSQTVTTGQLFAEAGYPLDLGQWQAQPFVGIAWADAHADGDSEKGGAAALRLNGASLSQSYSTVGIIASTNFSLLDQTWLPSIRAAWQHGFASAVPQRDAVLLSGSSALLSVGTPLDRDRALVNADLGILVGDIARASLGYQGALSQGGITNGLRADLSMAL